MISPWAKALTEEFFPNKLAIGMVVKRPDGRTVQIVAGQYMGRDGLSNFWEWREVLPDGALSENLESGYGWDPDVA